AVGKNEVVIDLGLGEGGEIVDGGATIPFGEGRPYRGNSHGDVAKDGRILGDGENAVAGLDVQRAGKADIHAQERGFAADLEDRWVTVGGTGGVGDFHVEGGAGVAGLNVGDDERRCGRGWIAGDGNRSVAAKPFIGERFAASGLNGEF